MQSNKTTNSKNTVCWIAHEHPNNTTHSPQCGCADPKEHRNLYRIMHTQTNNTSMDNNKPQLHRNQLTKHIHRTSNRNPQSNPSHGAIDLYVCRIKTWIGTMKNNHKSEQQRGLRSLVEKGLEKRKLGGSQNREGGEVDSWSGEWNARVRRSKVMSELWQVGNRTW